MLSTLWTRRLQYAFIGIVTVSVGFSLYQWNASRAATRLQQSTSVNLSSGLVGYWSLDGDDISGTTAYDRSGSGNNGTLTNGPAKTAGRIGQALSFNGTNQYVTTSGMNMTNITVSAWVQINSGEIGDIFYRWTSGGSSTDSIGVSIGPGNKINVAWRCTGDYGTANSTNAINTGSWVHLVAEYDGNSWVFYSNGGILGTTVTRPCGGSLSTSASGSMYIGGGAGGLMGYLAGSVDEVRIYNRAISTNEVRALYDVGNPDKVNTAQGDSLEQGIVGYWKLDDASGTTATDSSGNANNGTLTNGPTWGTGQVNGATVFDGTDDYITLSTLQIAGATTLSAWIYPNNVSGRKVIVGRFESGNSFPYNYGYGLLLNGSTLIGMSAYNDLSWANNLNATVQAGVWQHVVFTITGSSGTQTGNLYVNGTLVDSYTGTADPGIAYPYGIGAGRGNFAGGFFNGKIDEVRSYNRALSSEEVGKLYRETAPDNPDTGLVGYWPMNGKDIVGTTAYDRSGKGMNGTLTNGPTRTAGRIGQALNFDGVNDRVSVGDVKTTGNFTYAAWVKVDPAMSQTFYIFDKEIGGTLWPSVIMAIDFATKKASVSFCRADYDIPTVNANQAIQLGVWTYIVGTYDGTNLRIYLNGTLDNTTITSGTPRDINNNLTIGARQYDTSPFYDSFAKGQIDEARVYSRALSANEIRALYDVGNPDKVNTAQGDSLEQGLAGYWKLDDASGTAATDSSGNANNGTLTNGPTWGTGQVKGDTVFDGVDDYIDLGSSNTYINTSAPFTTSFWMYPTDFSTQRTVYFLKTNSSTSWVGFLMNSNPSYRDFTFGKDGSSSFRFTFPSGIVNTWWHVTIVYNGSGFNTAANYSAYLNGVKVAVNTSALLIVGSNINLIGDNNPASAFKGNIDDFRVYNRALSSEEVGKLYRETAPDNPDTGLVGYWPMNGKDISGTTAYDRSGKGNNGTLTNGPTRTAGRIGQALSFDGVNDYVNGGSSTSLKPSLPISLSYWMKPTTVGSSLGHLSFREDVGHNGYWVTSANDASVSVSYGDDQGCALNYRRTKTSPASVLTANQWQHIVAIIRGATDMSIYVNGTDVGGSYTGIGGALVYDGTSFLRIGSVGGAGGCPASFFTGSLDEVRVYNRALSAAEIATLYEYGK